jgi:16S rRNA (cytosine967-C5)-methyltransferase
MPKEISPARITAYSILLRMDSGDSNSAELLAENQKQLEGPDRGLCHQVVLGTIRRQVLLDRLIESMTRGKRLDPEVRTILMMSIFQLRFLDRVPDYAVVNDAVNLAHRAGKASAKGLINAVLRGYLRKEVKLEFADEIDRLSVETSHPRWILEKWIADFGRKNAEEIARANCIEPSMEYRLTPKGVTAGISIDGNDTVDAEKLIDLADQGLIYIQDRGSQLVAETIELQRGERLVDVCAAPGGKASLIAMNNPDAFVFAGDVSLRRAQTMRSIFLRQDNRIPVFVSDAEKMLPFQNETFDVVFVDAPCTGTGTIRRNPEIVTRISPTEIGQSALRQSRILDAASLMVKSGGRLIYSTCSLEKEENEEVCESFLSRCQGFGKISLIERLGTVSKDGFLRTFPNLHGTDGFFVAAFLKK